MPNRILREGILTSERVNSLKPNAELMYRRLMSVVDDFGRYSADPRLIRSACYPLRVDEVREADISRWLTEVESSGLIALYAVDGKRFLQLADFRQQVRTKVSRYPAPPDPVKMAGGCHPVAAHQDVTCTSSAMHTLSTCAASAHLGGGGGEDVFEDGGGGGDVVVVEDGDGACAPEPPPPLPPPLSQKNEDLPTVDEVIACGAKAMIPPDYCREFHAKTTERRMWLNPRGQLTMWGKTLVRFWESDRSSWVPPGQRQSVQSRGSDVKPKPRRGPVPDPPDWREWAKTKGYHYAQYEYAPRWMRDEHYLEKKKQTS